MKQWLLMTVTAAAVTALVTVAVDQRAFAADAPVSPADALSIARKNACMGCHAVDRKLVGPSFQQIAAKYKGDVKAPGRLETKVRDGGSGVWGMLPMPSHRSMDPADITKVVGWILAGSPSK